MKTLINLFCYLKNVYAYEYMNNRETSDERSLPDKKFLQ